MSVLENNGYSRPEEEIGAVHRHEYHDPSSSNLSERADQRDGTGDAQYSHQEDGHEGDDGPEYAPRVAEDGVTVPHGLAVVDVGDSGGKAGGTGEDVYQGD